MSSDANANAVIEAALRAFSEARAAIGQTFSADSAAKIVAAVLSGRMPREGYCVNGLQYYVHGFGYTVIMSSGADVHLDGSDFGNGCDVFSIYDMNAYLRTSGYSPAPGIDEIRSALDELCDSGILFRFGNRFSVCEWTLI